MSVITKNIIPRKQAENSITTQYTATGVRCIIDKLTATNISASPVTIDVYLVAPGGTASDVNRVVKTRTIVANESYTFPQVVGQILEAGGFLATNASAASALVISGSGREVA